MSDQNGASKPKLRLSARQKLKLAKEKIKKEAEEKNKLALAFQEVVKEATKKEHEEQERQVENGGSKGR